QERQQVYDPRAPRRVRRVAHTSPRAVGVRALVNDVVGKLARHRDSFRAAPPTDSASPTRTLASITACVNPRLVVLQGRFDRWFSGIPPCLWVTYQTYLEAPLAVAKQ